MYSEDITTEDDNVVATVLKLVKDNYIHFAVFCCEERPMKGTAGDCQNTYMNIIMPVT